MPQNKKKNVVSRPIDAIRELIEDQQLQINDLTEIIYNQKLELRELKAKWNAKENLEREIKEKKKMEDTGWFWAARSSE